MTRLTPLALLGLALSLLLALWGAAADARILAVPGATPAQEARIRAVDAMLPAAVSNALPPMVVSLEDLGGRSGSAAYTQQDTPNLIHLDPNAGFDVGELYAHEFAHQWTYRFGSHARLLWIAKVGGRDGAGWTADPDEAWANAAAQYLVGTWVPWRSGLARPSDYRTWLPYQWEHASWPDVAGADAELVEAGRWVRQRGLMYGLDSGQFGSWDHMTRRQVFLVMLRVRVWQWLPLPLSWANDYRLATRDELAAAWPGLDWRGGTGDTYITRSAFARLLYRARIGR